jgi:hypothetical protein
MIADLVELLLVDQVLYPTGYHGEQSPSHSLKPTFRQKAGRYRAGWESRRSRDNQFSGAGLCDLR